MNDPLLLVRLVTVNELWYNAFYVTCNIDNQLFHLSYTFSCSHSDLSSFFFSFYLANINSISISLCLNSNFIFRIGM